jgi:hypothetical protein
LELLDYLKSFLQRAQPLFDLGTFLQQAESDALAAHMPIVEELKGDPLYCIACAKQFAKKGVYDGHLSGKTQVHLSFGPFMTQLSGKKHKEAAAAFVAGGGDAVGVARHRRVFVLQQCISALAKHLKPVIDATKNFTQKKLTLTYEELQQVACCRFLWLHLRIVHNFRFQRLHFRNGTLKRSLLTLKVTQRRKLMAMRLFIIPRMYLWVGTASPSPTGCTSCTDSISSTSVKFAATSVTGDLATLIAIFRSTQALVFCCFIVS